MALPLDKPVTTHPPRSVSLPGTIAHGLCTMAMWNGSVVTTVADDDPTGNGAAVVTDRLAGVV